MGGGLPRHCERIFDGRRGNSGVILCQILRGISGTFAPLRLVGADEVAIALAAKAARAPAGSCARWRGPCYLAADAALAAGETDEGGADLLGVLKPPARRR